MKRPNDEQDALIASIFSDGTALFREPAEPDPGDSVAVRLRIQKASGANITLLRGFPSVQARMSKYRSDARFDWYEAKLYCRNEPIRYAFIVEWRGRTIYYDRLGARWVDAAPVLIPESAFRVFPGFHVPEWSRGALQYQIFPDRFCNGCPETDVHDREYYYAKGYIRHAKSWDALPEEDDFRCFYGGDLVGVREKLDYLQSLGVEAIYFNPIFVSPSSHKYDVQDYNHIDPHLTMIYRDGGDVLEHGVKENAQASRYIRRTIGFQNIAISNAWFADFCNEVHARGMRIILDGVFNHCGSFNQWMDREGIYPEGNGAYVDPESPTRGFFNFHRESDYQCWWDVETLPKLNYERSAQLCEEIYRVAEKWAQPPYSIDGWRLDVAADLGLSPAFNHSFWKGFRRRVKAVNPNLLIIAEHYGDPSEWLRGDEWDSVMNYDAFMDPLSFFLTGMEKHSDYRRDDLYQNGEAFFESILLAMSRLPTPSVYCAMDELDNHDHSRFLTRTNGRVGRLNTAGSAAAGEGIHPEVFREAAVILMTWPGAPTIYYGDEAGVVGWTDPDNRRTYPWGHEDQAMLAFFRALKEARRALPVLRKGSVKPLSAGHGYITYARFDADTFAVVVCNNTKYNMTLDLPLRDVGAPDGMPIQTRLMTSEQGFNDSPTHAGRVADGMLRFRAPAHSASILIPERADDEA